MLNPRLVYGSTEIESLDSKASEILVPLRDDSGDDRDTPWRGYLDTFWRGVLS